MKRPWHVRVVQPFARLVRRLAGGFERSADGKPWFVRLLQAAKRAAVSTSIVVSITVLLLLLIEGASSVIVVLRSRSQEVLLERSHTEYDRELGWINERNVRVDDLYGPGLYMQTNSQRFRSTRDFERAVPKGKLRAICTGDSFTLGYGVKNDDAWCELLSRKDARLETVNMGQGGYGIDQAYLWYRRDGLALDHQLLIFAFTSADIVRTMNVTFAGYPKPVLSTRPGIPVIERWPGPRWTFYAPWIRQRLHHLTRLRFLELWRSSSKEEAGHDVSVLTEEQARRVILSIIDHLKAIQAERHGSLIVVFLPQIDDYRSHGGDPVRTFLSDELQKRDVPFLDMINAIRREPAGLVPRLFRGHYSELGNQWAADVVYDALTKLPRIQEQLGQIGPPPRAVQKLMAEPALERIALDGAKIDASAMGQMAPMAIDGSLKSRWHSGATQTGTEWIELELSKPRRISEIRLQLYDLSYDYGRLLAVDVAEHAGGYTEVLRLRGEDALQDSVDASNQSAQILPLPQPVTARYVRVRQLGTTTANFWSIAELELYGPN